MRVGEGSLCSLGLGVLSTQLLLHLLPGCGERTVRLSQAPGTLPP